jgi:DNA-binding GntR family transcriptional regulator
MIDRSSLEPPYAQVARGMRERILSGEYQAGDRLPSEAELCALYGVSRMTVRRAVKLLAQVKISEARIVPPSPRVCRKLALDAESPVVAIKRVISSAGEPVFYHSEYLVFDPRRPLVEAEYGVTALRDLLASGGKSGFKYGRLALHASTLTESEASYLGEEPGESAWVIEHLFFDFENRPVSWGRFIGRSDRLDFSTTVGVPDAGEGAGA